jgi:hypothetical protein
VLLACVGVALYRRHWRMALVVLLCPVVAVAIAEILKRLYNRQHGQYLQYPSGHTAMVMAVTGMVALTGGYRLWVVAVAIAASDGRGSVSPAGRCRGSSGRRCLGESGARSASLLQGSVAACRPTATRSRFR